MPLPDVPQDDDRTEPQIAIAGRGFSGMVTAIALMHRYHGPFSLTLYDPDPKIGGSETVTTAGDREILNSRVRDLSVLPGDPDDFRRWLAASDAFGGNVVTLAAAPATGLEQVFVPKQIFSDYVHARFAESLARRHDITLRISPEPVREAGYRPDHGLTLSVGGEHRKADALVLATGYGLPGPTYGRESEPTAETRAIVILGSSVRAVDRLLRLRDGGYAGPVTVISETGRFPLSHTREAARPRQLPPDAGGGAAPRLSAIVARLRRAAARAEEDGDSWQSVMNAFRTEAFGLWHSLSLRQKRQFARHLRPLWDSHRNRLPADHFHRFQAETANPQTTLLRGTITDRDASGLWICSPDGGFSAVQADLIYDCRPARPDINSPLVRSLVHLGLASVDALGIGLEAERSGRLVPGRQGLGRQAASDGRLLPPVHALGPLTLGSLPDSDLSHEIAAQAHRIAEDLDRLRRAGQL